MTRTAMLNKIRQFLVCFFLTALPLGGLIVFFEITQVAPSKFGMLPGALAQGHGVSAISGVNAHVAEASSADRASKLSAAKFAGRVWAELSSGAFAVGMNGWFMSEDGRFNRVTIVRRELLSDRDIPLEDRAMTVDLASNARGGTFFYGTWRYTFEIEELGTKQAPAVQNSL